jgi:hypothetical protein
LASLRPEMIEVCFFVTGSGLVSVRLERLLDVPKLMMLSVCSNFLRVPLRLLLDDCYLVSLTGDLSSPGPSMPEMMLSQRLIRFDSRKPTCSSRRSALLAPRPADRAALELCLVGFILRSYLKVYMFFVGLLAS